MFAYKQHLTIDDPDHVVLSHLPFRPGQKIEVLFLAEEGKQEVPTDQGQQRGQRIFGAMRGKAKVDSAFFEPLPEAELAAWES